MRHYPVVFRFREVDVVGTDGECHRTLAMVPTPRYEGLAAKQFHPNEDYALVILEARSRASHNHYFACIEAGFQNLPQNIAARWPSPEHLRHWCLVETGWCDEMECELTSESEARKLAARIRIESPYARIKVRGRKIIGWYPKSQSAAAMGRESFEASKKAVLDLLEGMIGVPIGSLSKEAGRAA
jgi:hypothetical protein